MSLDLEEPLTSDDREILSDMLFPLFEAATKQNGHVSRNLIRLEIGKFFPWPHIAEVLKELEERDYIDLLSTRDGGLYVGGEHFRQWAEAMKPIDQPEAKRQAAMKTEAGADITLSRAEAKALAALVRELAEPAPRADVLKKTRAALNEKSVANIIKILVN